MIGAAVLTKQWFWRHAFQPMHQRVRRMECPERFFPRNRAYPVLVQRLHLPLYPVLWSESQPERSECE